MTRIVKAHNELRAENERLKSLLREVATNIGSSPAKIREESVLVGEALERLDKLQQDDRPIVVLRAENERLRAKLQEAREALQELHISLHSQWRRPEECWEMSLIDDALSRTRTER